MRARPESTQLEPLSDASFLGKLLVLPANVRLDWRVIARYKCSSLFGLIISNEEKKFYNIDTCKLSSLDITRSSKSTSVLSAKKSSWKIIRRLEKTQQEIAHAN